jgi:hypothetical protein
VSVVLWTTRGEPLLAEFADEELVPYRRTLVGFTAEGSLDGKVRRGGDVGPPVCACGEDAEGIELEVAEEEEEEDEP